jgi:undecaprenyl-diphosphatase
MRFLSTIQKYDVYLFYWLIDNRFRDLFTKVWRIISHTGDGHLYVLLIAVLYWQQGIHSQLLQLMLLAFVIERPAYFILKNTFKRNRPEAALRHFHSSIKPSDQFSFPSGHTSAAFLVVTLVSTYFPAFFLPLFSWAGLVGFSRIALGVHFPSDIVVGALMGISFAYLSIGLIA